MLDCPVIEHSFWTERSQMSQMAIYSET